MRLCPRHYGTQKYMDSFSTPSLCQTPVSLQRSAMCSRRERHCSPSGIDTALVLFDTFSTISRRDIIGNSSKVLLRFSVLVAPKHLTDSYTADPVLRKSSHCIFVWYLRLSYRLRTTWAKNAKIVAIGGRRRVSSVSNFNPHCSRGPHDLWPPEGSS
jgi:hypothetical protein